MAIVYKHIRLDTNDVFYIGIGNEISRAYSFKNRNQYWKNIVNKTEYIIEIVLDDISWEEACLKEIELINFYGRYDLGKGKLVNMTDGGQGKLNYKLSEESIGRIKSKLIGYKHSKESNDKKRKASIGNKYALGNKFKLTQEQRDKISESNRRRSKKD